MQFTRTDGGVRHTLGPPRRQEVTFADGSALWLHACSNDAGVLEPFQRQVAIGGRTVASVDLRELAPELAYALPGASTRDASFATFHCLRKRFASVAQLRLLLPEEALQ